MARAPITVDDLSLNGRRGRLLAILMTGPHGFSDVCRAYDAEQARNRVERCRVRSALRDLRAAGWVVNTDWGWALTCHGVAAHHALSCRPERLAA